MTTLTYDTSARQTQAASVPTANLPFNLRVSNVVFGLLSNLGPDHVLFLPLSFLAICSGLVNYSWQREIALRGEELERDAFLHTGGAPHLTQPNHDPLHQ
jgi:hypothetical protein